jgi:S1-C subfamily serine protease
LRWLLAAAEEVMIVKGLIQGGSETNSHATLSFAAHLVSALVLILLLRAPPVSASPSEQGAAERVFRNSSGSVLVVEVNDERNAMQGSAVVYRSHPGMQLSGRSFAPVSIAITNAHVVGLKKDVTVVRDGRRWSAKVTFSDPELDLARLVITGIQFPAAEISKADVHVGSQVYAIGSPRGLENSLSSGLVSGFRVRESVRLVQTTAAISPGSSGGGLFDAGGALIGITTFKLAQSEGLNFAVSADHIAEVEDALAAAIAVHVQADTRKLSASAHAAMKSDDFFVWLRAARIGGGRLASAIGAAEGRVLKLPSGSQEQLQAFDEFTQLLDQTIDTFLARRVSVEATAPSALKSSDAQPRSPRINLLCVVRTRTGGRGVDIPVLLDLEAKTANGYPAEVSEHQVRWLQNDTWVVINRYAGTIAYYAAKDRELTKKGENFGDGRCEVAESRKF